jgi:hypothetical protein
MEHWLIPLGSFQVLAATEPLHNILSTTSGLPTPEGQLTTPFVNLMRKIYRSQEQQTLNPKELYTTFVKKYTYFKPYTQQDAQEFMRFLLEGLKSEVPTPVPDPIVRPTMKRTRRRTLMAAGTEETESPNPNPNPETQGTYIDQLFGGKLASYVVCDVCKSVPEYLKFTDHRYPPAMKISKIFRCPFTMQTPLTYRNETSFAPNSFVQIELLYSGPTNIPSRLQRHKRAIRRMTVEWPLMSEDTCRPTVTSTLAICLNDVVSMREIVTRKFLKLLCAVNSPNCLWWIRLQVIPRP